MFNGVFLPDILLVTQALTTVVWFDGIFIVYLVCDYYLVNYVVLYYYFFFFFFVWWPGMAIK